MKWIPASLLATCLALCSPLRTPVRLNPDSVKSPGDFFNVAPEAKTIIKPEYAVPKINAHVVRVSPEIIERKDKVGEVLVDKESVKYDPIARKMESQIVTVPKPLIIDTKELGYVKHEENVLVDVNSKAVIPPANDFTAEKKLFGTEPLEMQQLQQSNLVQSASANSQTQ